MQFFHRYLQVTTSNNVATIILRTLCGPVYDVSSLYHVLWSMWVVFDFSFRHVFVLEDPRTLDLKTWISWTLIASISVMEINQACRNTREISSLGIWKGRKIFIRVKQIKQTQLLTVSC